MHRMENTGKGTGTPRADSHETIVADTDVVQLQAKEHQDLLETWEIKSKTETDSPLETSERLWPRWHLDWRFLVSKTVEKIRFFVLSHPSFGTLAQTSQ